MKQQKKFSFISSHFSILNSQFSIPFLIFLISFSIYFSTTAKTNLGYADSDEITTNAYLLSVAHPPGYPLQILITKFFTLLSIPGSIAYKANIGSAFLQSLTLVTFYFLCLEIYKIIEKKSNTTFFQKLIAFFSSLTFGLTFLFWLYSTICEVFPLNNLLVMLTILASLKWYQTIISKNKSHKKYFFVTTALFGIGLSHVQTFCLLGPALLFFLIRTLKQTKKLKNYYPTIFIGFFLSISFFILPNLLLFWLNSRKVTTSWYFDQNLKGWLNMIFRQDYKGFNPNHGKNLSSYLETSNFFKNLKDLFLFPKYFLEHFSYPLITVIILGFIYIFKKSKSLFYYLFLLFIFTGPLLALYMGLPDHSNFDYFLQLGILQRQYLLSHNLIAIFIFFGFNYIYIFLKKIKAKFAKPVFVFISILLIIFLFSRNYKIIKEKNNYFLNQISHQMLESVDKDSVIICFSDMHCMSLIYAQEVEGIRPDVHIIPQNFNIKKYYLEKNPNLKGFDYIDNPYYLCDIISWNVANHRTVYLTNSNKITVEKLGIEGDPFFLIPQNHLLKIVTKIPKEIPGDNSQNISSELAKTKISPINTLGFGQKTYNSYYHSISGYIFHQLGLKEKARQNYQLAIDLNPSFDQPKKQLVNLGLGLANLNTNYRLDNYGMTLKQLIKKAEDYEKIRQYQKALDYYTKATYSDPLDIDSRQKLADLYLKLGYNMQAIREYQNILKYHPDQIDIRKKINSVPITNLSRYYL